MIIVVCGMMVLGMVGISLREARKLPWDARILTGRGPLYVPFRLAVVPAFAAVLYGIFVGNLSGARHTSRQPLAIEVFFFVLLALTQLWTMKTARSSGSSD